MTKNEHPPELASSPVSCEFLVYFLCEQEGKKGGIDVNDRDRETERRKESEATSKNVGREEEHKENLRRVSSTTGVVIDSGDTNRRCNLN